MSLFTVNRKYLKIVLFSVVLILFMAPALFAQIVSDQTGNWNTGTTWLGGNVPTTGDSVVIATGHTVTIDVNTAALQGIYINSGATLRFGSSSGTFTLDVDNDIENDGTIDTDDGGIAFHTIQVGGDFDNDGGTFSSDQLGGSNPEAIYVDFDGTSAMNIIGSVTFYRLTHSGSGSLTSGSDLITIKNLLDLQSGSGGFTAGSGEIRIEAGTFNIKGSSFDATTNSSTIVFQGSTAPTIDVDGSNISTLTLYNCTVKDADLTLLATNANVDFIFNNNLTLTDYKIVFSPLGQTESINYGTGSRLIYNGSSQQTVDIEWTTTLSPDNVTINNNNDVVISSGNRTINSNLALTSGELRHSGTLTVNGDIAGGTGTYGQQDDGTLVLNGSEDSNVSVTETLKLHNLTINKTFGSGVTVIVESGASINTDESATLYIQQGTLRFTATSQLTLGATNTLQIDADGILETGGTSIAGFSTYDLAPGSEIRFTGTAGETIPNATYGNLTVNNSAGVNLNTTGISLDKGTDALNSTLRVQSGALNLNSGTISTTGTGSGSFVLQVDNGATLRTADAAGTVSPTDITGFDTYTLGATSTLVYNGSGSSETIAGGTTAVAYGNLRLNNGSDFNSMSSSNRITVSGTVTFVNGVVLTTSGDQFILLPGATVSGANGNTHVSGPMQKQYDGSNLGDVTDGTGVIPVGKGGVYRPVKIDFTTISAGTITITAEQFNSSANPSPNPPTGFTDFYTGRHWVITESGGATWIDATLVLDYNGWSPAAPANVRILNGQSSGAFATTGTYSGISGTEVTHLLSSFGATDNLYAFAQLTATKYWVTNGNGDWHTGSNWNDGTVPSPGDIVQLNHSSGSLSSSYNVLVSSANVNVASLQINPDDGNGTATITLLVTRNATFPVTLSGSSGNVLDVGDRGTVTLNGPTGNGIFMENDGAINFGSGSTYNLQTGSGISSDGTRSFDSGSTTNISSTNSSALKATTYGALNLSHASGTHSVSGNVASQNLSMSGTGGSVQITGDLTVTGSLLKTSASGGTLTVQNGTLNTTSSLACSSGTIATTGSGLIDVGTTTYNAGTLSIGGSGSTSFTGNYTGPGAINVSGSGNISFGGDVSPSGNVTFSSQLVNISGDVNISGGTFTPSTQTYLLGTDFQTSGTGVLSTTSGNLIFGFGAGDQNISDATGNLTFHDMTIDKASGNVNLNSPVGLEGNLTLTQGNLVTTATNIITFGNSATASSGSNQSHINGPAVKNTNSTTMFEFPVGDGTTWRRIGVQATTSGAASFIAQFFDTDPTTAIGSGLGTGLLRVSSVRYWTLSRTSGSVAAKVLLRWEDASDGVENPTGLVVTHWNTSNTQWQSEGGVYTGDASAGEVTSSQVTNWTDTEFTIGTTTPDNPLPVQLAAFEALADFGKVTLNWTTASELDNQGFNIYRAEADGNNWQQINSQLIAGKGTTSQSSDYSFVDSKVVGGETYQYKLESVSNNGVRVDEKTIEVNIPLPDQYVLFNNYPNPFNPTTNIKFQLPEAQPVKMVIYDMNGSRIKTLLNNQVYHAGEHVVSWDASDQGGNRVASGIYLYRFQAGSYHKTGKMILVK